MPRLSDDGYEAHIPVESASGKMVRKASIYLYTFALIAVIAWEAVQIAAPNGSTGHTVWVTLNRGAFKVLDFPPPGKEPRAIVLFGTGDGGWSAFEEAICKTLQKHGYEAVGIDFAKYATTDYNLDTLQSDMALIIKTIRSRSHDETSPVILGGYSMGAAQEIAAAGGPHPPQGLIGLLVVDPRSRGRYGFRLLDQTDILPTGPGTFSMEEFTRTMKNLRVVQWHASEDSIDSRAWLKDLTAPHKEFDFGQTGHYYNNDRADFLTQLVESISWIAVPEQGVVTSSGNRG